MVTWNIYKWYGSNSRMATGFNMLLSQVWVMAGRMSSLDHPFDIWLIEWLGEAWPRILRGLEPLLLFELEGNQGLQFYLCWTWLPLKWNKEVKQIDVPLWKRSRREVTSSVTKYIESLKNTSCNAYLACYLGRYVESFPQVPLTSDCIRGGFKSIFLAEARPPLTLKEVSYNYLRPYIWSFYLGSDVDCGDWFRSQPSLK